MIENKLPADPSALVLGIVALVIGFAGCCCYGIFAIIPLILGIVGMVMANKSIKEYALHPEAFSRSSRANVGTAKVINIIAVVFNALVVLFFIGVVVFYGTMSSQGFYEEFLNGNETFDEWENDSIYDYDEDFEISEDTIRVDSISVEEIIGNEIKLDSLNN